MVRLIYLALACKILLEISKQVWHARFRIIIILTCRSLTNLVAGYK